MRKKVRKSLAFLLALALVVSVMSGLGLSVSADDDQTTTESAQTAGLENETGAGTSNGDVSSSEGEKQSTELVNETENPGAPAGEGSDDSAEDTLDSNGEREDEIQADPDKEEQDALVEEDSVPVVQADGEVSEYTITCGNQKLTVKLVDDSGNSVNGIAPENLAIEKNTATSIENYAAKVEGYTYSQAYYTNYNRKQTVTQIAYYQDRYYYGDGWYSVVEWDRDKKISDKIIYLLYEKNPTFTVHYVDESGAQIAEPTTEDAKAEITFKDYVKSIDGYTYWRACYSSANNAEVTSATVPEIVAIIIHFIKMIRN